MNPLIQGLFNKFKETEEIEGIGDDDAFELFSADLMLPKNILAQAEKTDFLLDAGAIGIDVVALEINEQLVWDPSDVKALCDSTGKIEVTLHFIQAKRSTKIKSADILGFGSAVHNFLQNSAFPAFPRLQELASAFALIFSAYATKLKSSPSVQMHFVSSAPRAATQDTVVVERATETEKHIRDLGFIDRVSVVVVGADELHDAWIKKNHANEVEIQLEKQVNLPKMPGVDQAILGVVSASELLKLVHADDGSLDEQVFYDNVRGFKGEDNPVNKQIITTLNSQEKNLLPVLNNGVTVVASSYTPKPGDAVAVSGFQVVNGCQTSHCLHLAQDSLGDAVHSVFVPIRLVVTQDEDVATQIIKATNSQTAVQENDLVALTKFQKQLEDFYNLDSADVNLIYERRSGQFYSADVTKRRVVTISDQLRSISAVFLDNPHAAARYTAQLYDVVGTSIFQDRHKLPPYVASAFAAYRIENAFRTGLDPSYKPARYHILMVCKYRILGGPSAPLNSADVERQSALIIQALKQPDQVAMFRAAAKTVVAAAGGVMPTSDRLKRQQFTQELTSYLMRQLSASA